MKIYANQAAWHRSKNHMCSQPCLLRSGQRVHATPIDEAPGPGSRVADKVGKGTSWSNSQKLVTLWLGQGTSLPKAGGYAELAFNLLFPLKHFLPSAL